MLHLLRVLVVHFPTMAIVLKGKIVGTPVFYEGYPVSIEVDVENRSDDTVRIAWISVEIHCQCTFNKQRVALPDSNKKTSQPHAFEPSQGLIAACISYA